MRKLVLILLVLTAACRRAEELPTLSQVPAFQLIAEDGRAFSSAELQGKIWVADLIFTNCPAICPRMTSQMKQVQDDTNVRLLSFSVDPERDTPPVMAAYAKRHRADPARWSFLTGPREELDKVSEAFLFGRIHVDHSSRFVLVDGQGRVRGFYQTDESGVVERLVKDIALLQGQ
jgi:protein SCO1